jgi:hypothetical protein
LKAVTKRVRPLPKNSHISISHTDASFNASTVELVLLDKPESFIERNFRMRGSVSQTDLRFGGIRRTACLKKWADLVGKQAGFQRLLKTNRVSPPFFSGLLASGDKN